MYVVLQHEIRWNKVKIVTAIGHLQAKNCSRTSLH